MKSDDAKVKSLAKALSVLECFTKEEPELGVTQLSVKLGLYKSNVHNILATLEACGYIEKNRESDRYRLGLKILELSNVVTTSMGFRQKAYPLLCQLSAEVGEVVYYGIPADDQVLYLDAAYPQNSSGTRSMLGVKAPMFCTAIGKAMLAFLPGERAEAVLALPLESFTDSTVTDPDVIRAELEVIRARGYSVDNMEHEYGIKCVGAPVFGPYGEVRAGISTSGPSLRFTEEKIGQYARKLQETAEKLSG